MTNKLADSLDTIWKYERFVATNLNAFRASKQLYEVRTNLALAASPYRTLGKSLADYRSALPLAWMIGGAKVLPRVVA